MLNIDYALVPFTHEDREQAEQEIAERIDSGRVPQTKRGQEGRVVVLNPDPVQTDHQVPDELRPFLRRIMMPCQEGSLHLKAEKIFNQIKEPADPLYVIVLELESEFRELVPFLDCINRLRAQHPQLKLVLSGHIDHLIHKFHQILEDSHNTLLLNRMGGKNAVEVDSKEALDGIISTQEDQVVFSTPFFSQLRIATHGGKETQTYNLSQLKSLFPIFGVGEAVEVQVDRGRKERMMVIDIPLDAIKTFQFRPDRSPEFYGVRINGSNIPTRHFGDEKLEYRWVPMKTIEAFIKRPPGRKMEDVEMGNVRALRINTLTMEVAFVLDQGDEVISLESIDSVAIKRRTPLNRRQISEGLGAEDEVSTIVFDKLVRPQSFSMDANPVHQTIRRAFLGSLIRDEVENSRKLEIYTSRLAVGVVGPLAGQLLKILRRFGLEKLISPDSFYYLCDDPENMPDFHGTPERFEAHFASLVETLKGIFGDEEGQGLRMGDIAYNLPITTEWIDTELATFDNVTGPELEAAYHEMGILANFITHEFQRTFNEQGDNVGLFSKMEDCRTAGLMAKWMADIKQGAYGRLLPEDIHPDVIIFANEQHKKENDHRFFFPSIAATQLIKDKATQDLFAEMDYDFSVLLEDEMALAVHICRDTGVMEPTAEDMASVFHQRQGVAQGHLKELEESLRAYDDTASPIYQKMLKKEEEEFHQRFQNLLEDQKQIDAELTTLGKTFGNLFEQVAPALQKEGFGANSLKQGAEPKPGEEQEVVKATGSLADKAYRSMHGKVASMNDAFSLMIKQFEQIPNALKSLIQRQHQWQRGVAMRHEAEYIEKWEMNAVGRMTHYQELPKGEWDSLLTRLEGPLENARNEMKQASNRVAQQQRNTLRVISSQLAMLMAAKDRVASLSSSRTLSKPKVLLNKAESVSAQMLEIAKGLAILTGKVLQILESLEQARVRRERQQAHILQLQQDKAVLKSLLSGEKLPPSSDFPAPQKVPPDEELAKQKSQWQTLREQLKKIPKTLGGLQKDADEKFRVTRGETAQYNRVREQHHNISKVTARMSRLREAQQGLIERKSMMELEKADLPDRVRELYMPARKKLLLDIFIPEDRKRTGQYQKMQGLIKSVINLSQEHIRNVYLDRAIFRRFYSRQFVQGWMINHDPNSPSLATLRNIQPSFNLMLQSFRHNFTLNGMEKQLWPELHTMPHMSVQEMMTRIEGLAKQAKSARINYAILPCTLPTRDGLNLIKRKDDLYEGVPQLVLIFVTKFDPTLLNTDHVLRENYFKALKHNVVINVDGREVIDNSRAIAARIVRETIGCVIDMQRVEELSDDEQAVKRSQV